MIAGACDYSAPELSTPSRSSASHSEGQNQASEKAAPTKGEIAPSGEIGAGYSPRTRSLLRLQRSAGNQAVQRIIQRQRQVLIQREDTLYVDTAGVSHSEPEPTTTPGVIHIDERGVGHEHPDKSKAPSVLYMDESGVGHKEPDQSTTPEVLHMDDKGVGHEKPDEVDSEVAGVKAAIQKTHDTVKGLRESVTNGMKPWAGRLASAVAKRDETGTAFTTAKTNWDIEHKDAGSVSADWAELADGLVGETKQFHDDTVPEHQAVKNAYNALVRWQAGHKKNLNQFRKDRARWSSSASPLTQKAIKEIRALFTAEDKHVKAGVALGATADAEFAKFKAAWDAAAEFADKTWTPLKGPGAATYRIVGHLQQKLNATRADGTARLPITALFLPETVARVRAYQSSKGLTVTGRADVPTWTALNADAPSVIVNGQLTVESKEGAQSTKALNDSIHPDLSFGSSGAAVKEMQQRLNNWRDAQPKDQRTFWKLNVDGSFGFRDGWVLQAFQKSVGLPQTGKATKVDWAELDKVAGPVMQGTRKFDWRESVEGISNVGTTAEYDWEVKDGKLTITVGIKFTGEAGHAMVNTWLTDIREVWNNYKAVEQDVDTPREFNVDFNPVKTSKGVHTVNVGKPTPTNPNPRSDSANWYVNDNRRGLAPHEFGHLIGLEDEYNRPEEQGVAASGLEPAVGQITSTKGSGSVTVAREINTILTGNNDKTGDERLGMVVTKMAEHGLTQGAFARLVAIRYQGLFGFDGEPDMAAYFAKHNGRKWTTNLTRATRPFLTSNTSLMGTMTHKMDRTEDMTALAPHDHPVQPRHIRDFANLMTLAIPGTKWKPERR